MTASVVANPAPPMLDTLNIVILGTIGLGTVAWFGRKVLGTSQKKKSLGGIPLVFDSRREAKWSRCAFQEEGEELCQENEGYGS